MSWQLGLVNAQLRLVVKPRLRLLSAPERARRELELAGKLVFRRPPFLRHIVRPGGLHWINTGAVSPRRVIFYIHGGGYVAGSPWSYEGMLGRLSKLTGIEVCAPRYRLVPEAAFPAQFDDACAAWSRLLALGYAPSDVILMGDSAGGGLALALLAHLCTEGAPPRAGVFFSPWTDLAMTGASLTDNKDADPIFPVSRLRELCDLVLGGADPKDPRISPLYADFPGCPPVLLHYGAREVLRDDSARMATRLRQFDATVTETEYERVAHAWQLFDGWVPEARDSLRAVADYVQASFAETSR